MKRLCVLCVLAVVSDASLAPSQVPEKKPPLRRLSEASDEELRKQLLAAPVVGFDQATAGVLYSLLGKKGPSLTPKVGKKGSRLTPNLGIRPDIGPLFLAQLKKAEALTLPWRAGADCQLGKEAGEMLQVSSMALRANLRQSVPAGDIRPHQQSLRSLLFEDSDTSGSRGKRRLPKVKSLEWNKPEAIPAIQQLLQAENTPIRAVMVDLLAGIEGKAASIALAQRALFDLSPEIRQRAVEALATRSPGQFKSVLLDGFRYPWQPVAEHAAEAVVALKLSDAVPALVALLKESDPRQPFTEETKKGKYFIRELVGMNHLANCTACHAPSLSKEDLVRGRVPIPGEDPPPLYYAGRTNTGTFVRADVTFLKQDFSVPQPVVNNGKWPGIQRFDYFVRTRQLTTAEVQRYKKNLAKLDGPANQEPLLFALRELSGKDLGRTHKDWLPLLNPIRKTDGEAETPRRSGVPPPMLSPIK